MRGRAAGLAWGLAFFFAASTARAEKGSNPIPAAFLKLGEKVEAAGFPGLPRPLRIRGSEMPVLTEEGEPDISDLRLSYTRDGLNTLPGEWVVELTAAEFESAASWLRELEKSEARSNVPGDGVPGPGALLYLRATGLAVWRLTDLQFSRPLGGKKRNVVEWRLPFTALTAERLSLVKSEPGGGQSASVVSVSSCLLGGEFRLMDVDTKKETVELGDKERVTKVGMKLKDPKRKSVSLGLPRPESGEMPTLFMATVGRTQYRYEVVSSDAAAAASDPADSTGWVFRGGDGTACPELILPSQFDGQEALGVFLRVKEHRKEPFRPRTREAKIEVILVEVRFEDK